MIISKFPLILGSSTAGIPALHGRRFTNCFRKLGRGSYFAGVGFSCLSLLSAAISLPAMSKEVKLLNVSYGADGHPATFGSKLRLISPGVPKGNKNAFKHGHIKQLDDALLCPVVAKVRLSVQPRLL